MKNTKVLALLIGLTLSTQVFAAEARKIVINSFIGVEIGADIAQYEETLSLSRNQTRKMYMDEIIDAAYKLSGGLFDPTAMLEPLQKIQEAADRKRDNNKEIDSVKIAFSVSEFFKTEMETLHRRNGITASERRISFANMFPVINNRVMYNPKAQYDHYVFIQMAHIGGGQFRMSGTLGSINNGLERSFEGSGYLENALAQVTEKIFRSIMEIERPAWINPNPALTWIPGPASISNLDAREARAYCLGQEARLPLADELISAHQGTAYRAGGIDRFIIGENYFVADQMRQAGVPYIVLISNDGEKAKPIVMAVSGQSGRVWCVRGAISEKNATVQTLYSIRRKLDPKGMSLKYFPQSVPSQNLAALKAIESLLIHLNAPGAELGVSLSQSDLMDVDSAIIELASIGHIVRI